LEELQKRGEEALKLMEAAIARSPIIAGEVQNAVTAYKAGTLGDKLQKSASGLKYIILEPGTGASVSRLLQHLK